MFIVAVVSALVLGFMAGLFAFKSKDRWCPECGATKVEKALMAPALSRAARAKSGQTRLAMASEAAPATDPAATAKSGPPRERWTPG